MSRIPACQGGLAVHRWFYWRNGLDKCEGCGDTREASQ